MRKHIFQRDGKQWYQCTEVSVTLDIPAVSKEQASQMLIGSVVDMGDLVMEEQVKLCKSCKKKKPSNSFSTGKATCNTCLQSMIAKYTPRKKLTVTKLEKLQVTTRSSNEEAWSCAWYIESLVQGAMTSNDTIMIE